jgi:hypothetical protein
MATNDDDEALMLAFVGFVSIIAAIVLYYNH